MNWHPYEFWHVSAERDENDELILHIGPGWFFMLFFWICTMAYVR